jgi:alanine racemase
LSRLSRAGFSGFLKHAASSGGAIFYPESHFDMVRIGMGLYGYLPINSKFPACAGRQIPNSKFLSLKPVLTWKTVVGEIKEIPKGEYIGYDLTEKTKNKTKIAVLPVGYWHGYDRGLSGVGEVLIGGKRRRVLGRVSMDMVVVDVSNPPLVKVGDEVVLVGKQGKEAIRADELAQKIKTSHYEFLTRINPLIKRLVK